MYFLNLKIFILWEFKHERDKKSMYSAYVNISNVYVCIYCLLSKLQDAFLEKCTRNSYRLSTISFLQPFAPLYAATFPPWFYHICHCLHLSYLFNTFPVCFFLHLNFLAFPWPRPSFSPLFELSNLSPPLNVLLLFM